MRKPGSKERIRQFLKAHVGEVVSSIQLRDAAGSTVSEWARRVRELREDEGWKILTHNDSLDLRPGQYLLSEIPPESQVKFGRGISENSEQKSWTAMDLLARCVASHPARSILTPDAKFASTSGTSRTRRVAKRSCRTCVTLCSTCNQGAKNITGEKPTTIWLLSQIRRAGQLEQRAAFDWLAKKLTRAINYLKLSALFIGPLSKSLETVKPAPLHQSNVSLISHHLHPYTLKDIWPVFYLNLIF